MKTLLLGLVLLSASPAFAQVALNVNQTNTLSWDWAQTEGPVRAFVFQCGRYMKEIVDPDVRRLTFGSLVDAPGTYTGCSLTAKNEAGSSAPVPVPDFRYAYSYTALWTFLLELAAALGAIASVVVVYGRKIVMMMPRRVTRPLGLPEPLTVINTEVTHVHRYP